MAKQRVLERSPEHDRLHSVVVDSDVGRRATEERNRGVNGKSTNQANKKTSETRTQEGGNNTGKIEGGRWTG